MIGWQVNVDDDQMKTNIHALSRIWTHGLSVQAIKTYDSDCAATRISKMQGVEVYLHTFLTLALDGEEW
jgi:hypothetical protein